MMRLASLMLGLIAVATAAFAASPSDTYEAPRIVAFGDIHGDYDHYVQLLQKAGLVDSRLRWTGGDAHMVQLGDITDRGPDSRKIADLLMSLQRKAKRARGHLHFVIGNHEAMNMVGDTRYVHPGEYEAFRTSDSERRLDRLYETYVEQIKESLPEEEWPVFDGAHRAEWDKTRPPGYVELRRAWSPRGKYGLWLLKQPSVLRINDILFVHGGIGPRYVAFTRRALNDGVHDDIRTGAYNPEGMAMDEEGPLWYRGLAMHDETEEGPHVGALLDTHGVSHVVIGHTPLSGAILPRFDGRVIMIDVGLGAHYGGREAWLEIEGDTLTAWHRGTPIVIPMAGGQERIDYLISTIALDPIPSPSTTMLEKLVEDQTLAEGE